MLRLSATAAAELLSSPREESVLHGDIHHDNVLDFGERGWLAIDPKRLYGERGFDYANIFCNPNYGIATDPAIFQRRVEQVCRLAGLERRRLLQWIPPGRGSPPPGLWKTGRRRISTSAWPNWRRAHWISRCRTAIQGSSCQ